MRPMVSPNLDNVASIRGDMKKLYLNGLQISRGLSGTMKNTHSNHGLFNGLTRNFPKKNAIEYHPKMTCAGSGHAGVTNMLITTLYGRMVFTKMLNHIYPSHRGDG